MRLTSPAFEQQQKIPAKYTCAEKGINPPLQFSDISEQTKSLVLIMDDPDAPMGTFVHWLVYNIDPSVSGIAENTTPPGVEGVTSMGKAGYVGPCPPTGTHRYFFNLYALDTLLDLKNPDKKAVKQAMQGHILDQAELISLYNK